MSIFRLPRITTAQRTPLVLELGELVYDTDLNQVFRGNGLTAGGLPFGGASLSSAAPQALGTAAPGTAADASRADHVHPMPTAAQVGADPAGTGAAQAAAAVASHVAASDPHPQYLTPAEGDIAYAPAAHVGADAGAHALVVAGGSAGFMSGADKTKLDGIAAGATVGANWSVNLTNIPANIVSWAGIAPTAKQDTLTSSTSNTVSGTQVQRAALTGDVTAAANSNATTIANDAVTNAKAANMAVNTIKGRITAGTGDPEDLTAAQVRTIINVADGATANATDAALRDRATHTGTQAASTISDFAAASRAQAEAFLVAGTNVSITYSGSGATRTATINATGGGGGGTWGSITGTLSAQADLQTALGAKLDDSQATAAGLALLGAADAAAQRAGLGLGTAATQAATAFDPAGSATAARAAHEAAADPHPQYMTVAEGAAAYQPLAAPLTSLAALVFAGNASRIVRLNPAGSAFEFFDAPTGGGAVTGGTGTITVTPVGGALEWLEAIPAAGVTPASRVEVRLAGATDADENDPEMIELLGLWGTPGTGTITVGASFGRAVGGPINLHWSIL